MPTDEDELKNSDLRARISKFNMHGENHLTRKNSRCNSNGACSYGYP